MGEKYRLPRGTKARLEQIKLDLLESTIVYATDTGEIGIKRSDGNIEYFKNANDVYSKAEVDALVVGGGGGDVASLITDLQNGSIVVDRALNDNEGNPIVYTYANSMYASYNDTDNQIFIELRNKDGNPLSEETITLPKATTLKDGLLSKEDKIKIDNFTNGGSGDITETDPVFTAWNKSTGISITKSQVSDLIVATQALPGLMSATDKQRLDALHALLEEDTANNVVDSINEVLAIFNNYPEGADLVTALAGKVDKVTGKGLSTNDLTNILKTNYDNAYTHSQSTHAPINAQKNSDITKAEIEAKLIGAITSHSHALPSHNHDDRYYTETEIDTMIGDIESALNAILGV